MSQEESMRRLEEKLGGKLDENLKATTDIGTEVKLLSQLFDTKDREFVKFEEKTERNIAAIQSRVETLEKSHAEGTADRETMAGAKKAFVKWMVVSLCGLVVAFGSGITMLAIQISKIG